MKERKTFWDKNAGRYDRFMRKDRAAYEKMYELRVSVADGSAFDLSETEKEIKISVVLAK